MFSTGSQSSLAYMKKKYDFVYRRDSAVFSAVGEVSLGFIRERFTSSSCWNRYDESRIPTLLMWKRKDE